MKKYCDDNCKHLLKYCDGFRAVCNLTNRSVKKDRDKYLTVPGCKFRTEKEEFTIHTDKNFKDGGQLIPINFLDLPITPRRIFTITNVHPIELRGGHAHKIDKQVLVCISGEINVIRQKLDQEEVEDILHPGEWVFHPNLEMITMDFKTKNSTLLSICELPYNPDDYLYSFEEIRKYINRETVKAVIPVRVKNV